MSHEIDTSTGKAAVFAAGDIPWHGLGQSVTDAVDSTHAIQLAGLDWIVEQWPLEAQVPNGSTRLPAANYLANVRTDTKAVLGVVGRRYRPFQNRDAFAFADAIVSEGRARYETAGSLRGGRRVWMLVKLPQELRAGKEDLLQPYLLLFNSHDGTSCLRALLTSVRVVCANTLRLALHGHDRDGLSLRHRGNLQDRVEEAQKTLGLVQQRLSRFQGQIEGLRAVSMTSKRLGTYFSDLLPELPQEASERQKKSRSAALDQLQRNFEDPMNSLPGMKGTLWAALNAATEYADHQKPVRGQNDLQRRERRLDSVWFGAAEELKASAWRSALELAELN